MNVLRPLDWFALATTWCGGEIACDDHEKINRARVFVLTTALLVANLLFFSVFFATHGRPSDAAVMVASVPLVMLNVLWCRRIGEVMRPLVAVGWFILFLMGYLSYREAGLGSISWWLIMPAFLFIYSQLYQSGFLAVLVALLFQAGMEGARRAGVALPNPTDSDPELLTLLSRSALFVVILLALFVIDRTRNTMLRNLRLSNRQLEAARDKAQAATLAKSRFLSTMSHEIRTPLHGMLGVAQLLERTPLDDVQRNQVESIARSGKHLMGLVNDVLEFSKLEAGKVAIELSEFSIREVVEEAAAACAPTAHAKGVILAACVDLDVPVVLRGDGQRLRQVLINLLGNAVKFTEEGEVVLSVSHRAAAQGGAGRLRCMVRDTGIGIAPEHLPCLFTHFFQADDSATRQFGGSGLGLAISAELVQAMQGAIKVESTPGVGSCFVVEIDCDPAAGQPSKQVFAAAAQVAVIDTCGASQQALCMIVREFGLQAVALLGEAREAAGECQPDVVIVASRALREPGVREMLEQRLAGVPRVVAVPSGVARENVAWLGAATFVEEPPRRAALGDVLRVALGLAGTAAPASAGTEVATAGLTVLVAEDNPVNRLVAVAMLEQAGCRADVVADGVQAVEHYREGSYDVVLMDCDMPRMDGLEATRRIRAFEGDTQRPRTRIVAVTANAFEEDRARCRRAGMDAFLCKPFERTHLLAALDPAMNSWA